MSLAVPGSGRGEFRDKSDQKPRWLSPVFKNKALRDKFPFSQSSTERARCNEEKQRIKPTETLLALSCERPW